MGYNWAKLNMIKGLYILVSVCCILFAGCKKVDDELDSKEDLSYLIRTYYRYESNNQIIKQTWTYDGYKMTSYQYFVDGKLSNENKNYSYNGLNATWDSYTYQNNEVTHYAHVETEYLDETFLRTKYSKTEYHNPNNPQNNYIEEYYNEYDGKKKVGHKLYRDGILQSESHCSYNGLRCLKKITFYNSQDVIFQVKDIDIVYLDDTYLRDKSYMRTTKRYDVNGELVHSDTYYYVRDFDGKKEIGCQSFSNGELISICRDYHYDGLSCYYFVDDYQDGEVISTRINEVEYLE